MERLKNTGDYKLEATYELIDAIKELCLKMDLANEQLRSIKTNTGVKQ